MNDLESKLRPLFPEVDWSQEILPQLSSIAIVTLIAELESFFKIEIHPMEVDQENFSSLAAIQIFIEKKLHGRG